MDGMEISVPLNSYWNDRNFHLRRMKNIQVGCEESQISAKRKEMGENKKCFSFFVLRYRRCEREMEIILSIKSEMNMRFIFFLVDGCFRMFFFGVRH